MGGEEAAELKVKGREKAANAPRFGLERCAWRECSGEVDRLVDWEVRCSGLVREDLYMDGGVSPVDRSLNGPTEEFAECGPLIIF